MLSVEIIVPEFELQLENEEEVVRAMGRYQLEETKRRLRAGQGSDGPLAKPKDGGKPMRRSEQILESIRSLVKKRSRYWEANIEPTGERSDARDRQASKRRRVNAARKALATELRDAGEEEAAIKKQTMMIRGRKVRTRNMDVAAILAYPPKDEKAKAGARERYDLFFATKEERENQRRIAALHARFALVEKGTGTRHRGRGDAT